MELRHYASIIFKWWWLILLTTALGAGGAYYTTRDAPIIYQTATTLTVDRGSGDDPRDDPSGMLRASEVLARSYVLQIQSSVVLQEVQTRLGLAMSVNAIKSMLSVSQMTDAPRLITISARGRDPVLVKALVETTAQVFIEMETVQQEARYQSKLAELEAEVVALEKSLEETQKAIAALGNPADLPSFARLDLAQLETQRVNQQTRLATLLRSVEEFRLAMARYTTRITIFAPAEAASAIGSQTTRNIMLAAAVGLMAGAGLAFLIEYVDDTVRTPDDIKRVLPISVLGIVPHLGKNGGQTEVVVAKHPLRPAAEAFRNLRTSIQFTNLDEPPRTLLVTSPQPTDGKSFTAANLAAVIAQGGKSVILVDADLRHPTLHHTFNLPLEPGLTEALLSVEDRPRAVRQTEVERMRIVSVGARAPDSMELLASQTFKRYIGELREQADVVVLDSPPVLAVSDAAVLSTLVDGVVLVMDAGKTRIPAAVQAAERIVSVGGVLLGVVLNRVKARSGGYYYYYYYHDYTDDRPKGLFGWMKKRRRHRRQANSHQPSAISHQPELTAES